MCSMLFFSFVIQLHSSLICCRTGLLIQSPGVQTLFYRVFGNSWTTKETIGPIESFGTVEVEEDDADDDRVVIHKISAILANQDEDSKKLIRFPEILEVYCSHHEPCCSGGLGEGFLQQNIHKSINRNTSGKAVAVWNKQQRLFGQLI